MKKIILGITTIIIALIMLPLVKAEKVPVYMFTKEGCPACESAFEYFDELEKEYPDLFQQYRIEVFDYNWNIVDSHLSDLLISVLSITNNDTTRFQTPTIVIGDFLTRGIPQDTSIVYNAIIEARDAEEKVDIVKDEAEKAEVDLQQFIKKEDAKNKESGKYDTIIIVSIFVVLIGGFIGLVVISKK